MTVPARREPLSVAFPRDALALGALEVCATLGRAGHQAFLAGGCVRDLLLGQAVMDYDIASSASPAEVANLFSRTVHVGAAFGVSRVVMEQGTYDVARFRTEGPYSDGRHPDQVGPGSPEEDAWRRDFTINGLFLDPGPMEIVDHVEGLEDLLVRRCIRAIGDPHARLREDRLRLVRAVRFAASTGFAIEARTRAAVLELAPMVRQVAPERVRAELARMLELRRGAGDAVRYLVELGLLQAILPGVVPGGDAERGHWLTRVSGQVAQVAALSAPGGWVSPLAVLLEPEPPASGAARTARVELAQERLRPSRKELQQLGELLACLAACAAGVPADQARRKRLCRRSGFPAAVALMKGDPQRQTLAREWQRIGAGFTPEELTPPPLLGAVDLLDAGVPPGPRLGALLQQLEEEQLADRVRDRQQALEWLADQLTRG